VLAAVGSLPRSPEQVEEGGAWHSGACGRAVAAAMEKGRGTDRSRELAYYFRSWCGRDPSDRDMVVAAFLGVLAADFAGEE
jgi:hypothetical protein